MKGSNGKAREGSRCCNATYSSKQTRRILTELNDKDNNNNNNSTFKKNGNDNDLSEEDNQTPEEFQPATVSRLIGYLFFLCC